MNSERNLKPSSGHENSPYAASAKRVVCSFKPGDIQRLKPSFGHENSPYAASTERVVCSFKQGDIQRLKPSFGHENSPYAASTERVVCSFKLPIAIAAVLLAVLFAMSLLAGRQGYQKLLLVTPCVFGTPGLNPEKLEEFSEEEFLLTYEIKRIAAAKAINSKHTVTLVGTNQNYTSITGYASMDGGFFTKAAWDAKNKHAVLNETAAFKIFGSSRITGQTLKLDGEPWIVTGVIDDGDAENANIYVPSSVTGGEANSLMALMDGKAISEAYAKNALKSIGIHENNYAFINLSKSAFVFYERFSVAWKSALFYVIILLALKSGGGIMRSLYFYRSKLREIYFRELLSRHRAQLVKTAAGFLFFIGGAASALLLSLQILGTCLTWQELVPLTSETAVGVFSGKLAWLRDYEWIDAAVFAVYIGIILLKLILDLLKQSTKEQVQEYAADHIDS